jgi:hypothetical protein
MEFKGTKGKWIVAKANMKDTNKDELTISLDGGDKLENGYRLIACISPIEKADKIDFANALLISKAPEMLEMLKELVKQNTYRGYEESEDVIEAKQLIKEATELNKK